MRRRVSIREVCGGSIKKLPMQEFRIERPLEFDWFKFPLCSGMRPKIVIDDERDRRVVLQAIAVRK